MEYHKENDEMDNDNENDVGTVVHGNFDGRTDDCSPLLLFILLALAVFSDLLLEIK